MPNTFTLIQAVTVGSGGSADITFSSIPGTYTDLVVKFSGRTTTGSFPDGRLQFNNDTGSNYNWRNLYGSGSAAGSNNGGTTTSIAFGTLVGSSETANTFTSSEIYIPNYAGSTQKSVSSDSVTENNATTAYMAILAGLWTSTSAITSIKLTTSATAFAQYSTAYLYGIVKS